MNQNCKVAVLDSGIDSTFENDKKVTMVGECYDDNGHGTMCYSIIKRMAPESEFEIHKILNSGLGASSERLIELLEDIYAKETPNIIHMSLSTSEVKYRDKLRSVCKRLREKGAVIVASSNNEEGVESFPCDFEEVIGVDGGFFDSDWKYEFNPLKKAQVIANKVPVISRGLGGYYRFFGGTSKAAACITGILASNWGAFDPEKVEIYMESLTSLTCTENRAEVVKDVYSYCVSKWNMLDGREFDSEAAFMILMDFSTKFGVRIDPEGVMLTDFDDPLALSKMLSAFMGERYA